jgi:hypothetical protein
VFGEAQRECDLCLLPTRKRSGLSIERYLEALKSAACIRIVPAGVGVTSVGEQVIHGKVLVEGLFLSQETNRWQHLGTWAIWVMS